MEDKQVAALFRTPEQSKQTIKYYGRGGLTTRSGAPSNRNLDKPFRHPRVIENADGSFEPHPLDMMKLGAAGKRKQTNGCIGDVSSFQGAGCVSHEPGYNKNSGKNTQPVAYKVNDDRRLRIIVKNASTKGRDRNAVNRKPFHKQSVRVPLTIVAKEYANKVQRQFTQLRHDLLTLKWMGEIFRKVLLKVDQLMMIDRLNEYIRQNWPEVYKDFGARDVRAYDCLMGRVNAGQINHALPMNSIGQRLEKAAITINKALDQKGFREKDASYDYKDKNVLFNHFS